MNHNYTLNLLPRPMMVVCMGVVLRERETEQ